MLFGRDGECARLGGLLTIAATGRSEIVALRGDPGIGKTALLEYTASAAQAAGFRVVRVQGHEAEREMPFAALPMVVGPLMSEAAELPDVQQAALRGALNLGPAVHGDRMGVAAAALALVVAATERQPVLLTVDDVHLIDQPTVETLFFVLRRAHDARLLTVLAARSEHDVAPSVEQWLDPVEQIRLAGLDLAAARELTAGHGAARPLDPSTWTASGGNPLVLLELTAPQRTTLFLDEPVQLSARLLRAYGRRLVGLSAPTRESLLLVAVAGVADGFELARYAAGLVVVEQGVVRFRHPLVCSAVYHSASPALRRSAHQTMVAAHGGQLAPGAAERRAFHLAAATAGPDESVAGQLADAGKAAAGRHSYTTAAALFERAASLSPAGTARTQRILDAALAGQAAGAFGPVGPLLDRAIAETDDETLRTAAMHLQCRIQMWSGRPAQARDQLLDLAERIHGQSREWSAVMRAQAAIVSIALGEQWSASGMAAQATADVAHLADQHALPVLLAQSVTLAINGEAAAARALIDRCAPHLGSANPLSIDQLLVLAALTYALLGDVDTARQWLETAVRRCRGAQAAGLLPFEVKPRVFEPEATRAFVGALTPSLKAIGIVRPSLVSVPFHEPAVVSLKANTVRGGSQFSSGVFQPGK